MIAGHLSDVGVPVFVADVKGDLSGLAQPIDATDPKVAERAASLGWTVEPRSHPVEPLSLTGEAGAPVRATVESFGPVLLAKVLDLNETQTAVLSLVFRFRDDRDLPLSTWPTSARRCGSSRRTRASRCSRSTAASRRRPWASCCGRSSRSRRRGRATASGQTFFATVKLVTLTWTGATLQYVSQFRDGGNIGAAANTGSFTDVVMTSGRTIVYKVCGYNTTACSNTASSRSEPNAAVRRRWPYNRGQRR